MCRRAVLFLIVYLASPPPRDGPIFGAPPPPQRVTRVAVCCSVEAIEWAPNTAPQTPAVAVQKPRFSAALCVAVCCSVLQCVAVCRRVLHYTAVRCSVSQRGSHDTQQRAAPLCLALCCRRLHGAAERGSVLQCVAVWSSAAGRGADPPLARCWLQR